jgi:cyclopropane fatty-acyl-phospholipid synthase-like methyltransferase
MNNTEHYLHKEHPKLKKQTDFWGQVSRSVNGQPVSEEQIKLIHEAIGRGLQFNGTEHLLDLGCGNSALSSYFFNKIDKYTGVDFSEYLIEIANKYFYEEHKTNFLVNDVISFVKTEINPLKYKKALCYGVFSYLSYSQAEELLNTLAREFKNIDTLYIGNLPNRSNAHNFYHDYIEYEPLLSDNLSAIGIWRTPEEMQLLAESCGWLSEISVMSSDFYAAHYRFDAILTRKNHE